MGFGLDCCGVKFVIIGNKKEIKKESQVEEEYFTGSISEGER